METGRDPEVIYLNVYDVSSFNKALNWFGFGFYHTAVEIYGYEFSYGGHDYNISGIVCVEAGHSVGLVLKERIMVGITYFNEDEIDEVIRNFGHYWKGIDYDPFQMNCNNFTRKMVEHIADQSNYYYPHYINRFTEVGPLIRMWFKPL